ncbi:MAG: hypothetical protein VX951_02535 [Planctomycetota bacterium]|nr:hypothetical protein [Planctomycetota bacterium]
MQNIRWNLIFSVLMAGTGLGMGVLIGRSLADAAVDDPAPPPDELVFTKQALGNLGVELGTAELSSYTEYRVVQAVVQDAPLNQRTVPAPLSGIVGELSVEPGSVVEAVAPVLTMFRDGIPRTRLQFTQEIFSPVSESLHRAFTEFRTATQELQVVRKELSRIEKINASVGQGQVPLIPGSTKIQLEYDREKSSVRVANARIELQHHGLSAAEIKRVETGGHPPRGRDLWQRVLQVHGLWSTEVERLQASLPDKIRDLPWTTALLGELASTGLVTKSMVDTVVANPAIQTRFIDCASLLLQGETVAQVDWLAKQGALESRFAVRAPAGAVWDVVEVMVREGQPVAKGDPLVTLHDPRQMWLRMLPIGDEVPAVMAALRDSQEVSAVPLLRNGGPAFQGLRILRLASAANDDVAFLRVANQRLDGAKEISGSKTNRSWRLRSGMRYQVRIPLVTHREVYVFAKDGVAKEGVDRVVYLRNGDSFKRKAVHVIYENAESVVIASDGALFPGDGVVTRGAFALSVAMQQSSGGGNHGHSH